MSQSIRRVSKRFPCTVCGSTDWCGVAENFTICMRVRSDKQTANGGWIHRSDSTPVHSVRPKPVAIDNLNTLCSGRAELEHRDGIYAKLIREHLVLSLEHRNNLLSRGLTSTAINRNGYKSVPDFPFAKNVARSLSEYGLERVPGFYKQNDWMMEARAPGFYIPVRDERGRIQALQIRQDEGKPRYIWFSSPYKPLGASSGAPVHFQNTHLIRDTGQAIITEGALKADVIACLQNVGTIGIPGVSTFPEDFGHKLREQIPELKRTTVAFDSDWQTKPQVKQALFRLIQRLERAGFSVRVKTWWNGAKGYDDYLLERVSA
jgi:hypothetical protein